MEEKKAPEKRKFIKIPQTKSSVKQNFMLAAGLILVLVGILYCVKTFSATARIFALRPIFFLVIGALFLFLAFAFTGNSVFVFFGIFSILSGIVFILIDTGITNLRLSELWPAFVIASGIALFPAGFYKMRRVRTVYLFPAITLGVLGILFLMFSLHVIRLPFSHFIAHVWPVMILFFGIMLVFLYLWQQHNNKNFPFFVDDSIDDDDDDENTKDSAGDNN